MSKSSGLLCNGVRAYPGDLIEYKRLGYSHWAIYIGDDLIIEVNGTPGNKEDTWIRRKSLDIKVFDWIIVNNDWDSRLKPFESDVIVSRAKSYENKKWDYCLITNNCEHFAKWCRYGISISEQPGACLHAGDNGVHASVGLPKIEGKYLGVRLPSAHVSTSGDENGVSASAGFEIVQLQYMGMKYNAGLHSHVGVNENGFQLGVRGGGVEVGPVKASAGLAIDTGISDNGVKILGTGVEAENGRVKISVLGSSAECSIM